MLRIRDFHCNGCRKNYQHFHSPLSGGSCHKEYIVVMTINKRGNNFKAFQFNQENVIKLVAIPLIN